MSQALAPQGGWIAGCEQLAARVAALRAAAADPDVDLDCIPDMPHASADLRVDIKLSPARQAVGVPADFARLWHLWQDHYAQAFALARDHGVRRFGVCHDMAGGCGLALDDWRLTVQVCSEAISAAVADVNVRYGRCMVVEVKAPQDFAARPSFRHASTSDLWGDATVTQRLWDVRPLSQAPAEVCEQLDLFGGAYAVERAPFMGWAAD